MPKQKATRAAVTKASGKQIVIWFDPKQINQVDQLAQQQDLDRSKLFRRAITHYLAAHGK